MDYLIEHWEVILFAVLWIEIRFMSRKLDKIEKLDLQLAASRTEAAESKRSLDHVYDELMRLRDKVSDLRP